MEASLFTFPDTLDSVTRPASTPELDDRYGRTPTWRQPFGKAIVALIVVGFCAWVAWVAVEHSTPDVDGELVSFDITSPHEVSSRINVVLGDGVDATCRLRAMAEDKHTVGDLAFSPTKGYNDVVVRTEREATSVELLGCTVN